MEGSHRSQWPLRVRQTLCRRTAWGSFQTSCTRAAKQTTIFVFIYRFYSLGNAKLFAGVSLLTILVERSRKTKAVQIQLQHPDIWLTISCVFTMLGAQQEAPFRAKGICYFSLDYSKCLLISSCWCWLRKGLSPRCKVSGTSFPLSTLAAKTVIHFISLFLLGQPTPQ